MKQQQKSKQQQTQPTRRQAVSSLFAAAAGLAVVPAVRAAAVTAPDPSPPPTPTPTPLPYSGVNDFDSEKLTPAARALKTEYHAEVYPPMAALEKSIGDARKFLQKLIDDDDEECDEFLREVKGMEWSIANFASLVEGEVPGDDVGDEIIQAADDRIADAAAVECPVLRAQLALRDAEEALDGMVRKFDAHLEALEFAPEREDEPRCACDARNGFWTINLFKYLYENDMNPYLSTAGRQKWKAQLRGEV